MWRSVRQTPQALTSSSTSPGPGSGADTSLSTSGRPAPWSTIARTTETVRPQRGLVLAAGRGHRSKVGAPGRGRRYRDYLPPTETLAAQGRASIHGGQHGRIESPEGVARRGSRLLARPRNAPARRRVRRHRQAREAGRQGAQRPEASRRRRVAAAAARHAAPARPGRTLPCLRPGKPRGLLAAAAPALERVPGRAVNPIDLAHGRGPLPDRRGHHFGGRRRRPQRRRRLGAQWSSRSRPRSRSAPEPRCRCWTSTNTRHGGAIEGESASAFASAYFRALGTSARRGAARRHHVRVDRATR